MNAGGSIDNLVMDRMSLAWGARVSPAHKLMLLLVAGSGDVGQEVAAQFVGVTPARAAEMLCDLRNWGFVR
jgi:hypothetical protein